MRISDWSSDVCSSDPPRTDLVELEGIGDALLGEKRPAEHIALELEWRHPAVRLVVEQFVDIVIARDLRRVNPIRIVRGRVAVDRDRKSVVLGKSVLVLLYLCCGRFVKTKIKII